MHYQNSNEYEYVSIHTLYDGGYKIEGNGDFYHRYKLLGKHVLGVINYIQLKSLDNHFDIMKRWKRPEYNILKMLKDKGKTNKIKEFITTERLNMLINKLRSKSKWALTS